METAQNSKPPLWILSDMWGWSNALWKELYLTEFAPYFELSFIDVRTLAQIPKNLTDEQSMHEYYLEYGIDQCLEHLAPQLIPGLSVIGLSIGGYIAWRLSTLQQSRLRVVCISTTRLRYELPKDIQLHFLVFGVNDPFRPDDQWMTQYPYNYQLWNQGGHDIYKERGVIRAVSALLKK